jgi:hypothetical protein
MFLGTKKLFIPYLLASTYRYAAQAKYASGYGQATVLNPLSTFSCDDLLVRFLGEASIHW